MPDVKPNINGFVICGRIYRVTIQVVTNLWLTSKQKLRFKYMGLIVKQNFSFDVNRRFVTT